MTLYGLRKSTLVGGTDTKILTLLLLSMRTVFSSDFQEAFQLFDQKGDGRVQVSQIGDILRALGQNPTESDVKKLTHDHRPGQ